MAPKKTPLKDLKPKSTAVKGGKGHELYEVIRKIEAAALKDGRALTEAELKQIEIVNAESRKLYGEAIEKAGG